ncbi:MAG: RraA family protein [Bryobacteraceae bacterium]|jgi:regulator of RNase E activity RraA
MTTVDRVSPELLKFLRETDTCAVSNAIETFNVRMRNEGFIHGVTRAFFPSLPPVAGYAVTGRVRTTAPPIANLCYYHRTDFWDYVASVPEPKIIVIKDADSIPGTGALFGEIHAHIARALGCVGYVTNGTIRDIGPLKELGFPCFAGGRSVSHAYAHIIDFGEPVDIGGLKITPGDLLHCDLHGVQTVPARIAGELPETVARMQAREAELIRFCASQGFSIEKLDRMLKRERSSCQPASRF